MDLGYRSMKVPLSLLVDNGISIRSSSGAVDLVREVNVILDGILTEDSQGSEVRFKR